MSGAERDLVFIGDAHLDRGDAEVEAFANLVHRLAGSVERIVLLGDLFNLWIGVPELEQAHQRPVLEAFREARGRGTAVDYVEGNRDYRIGTGYRGDAFDRCTAGALDYDVERFGSVVAVHGDLTNPRDRAYRTWRAFSRSRAVWWVFNRWLPRARRFSVAEGVERRLRRTNRAYKSAFPEADVRRYGARFVARGARLVVLGHFHVERRLRVETGDASGEVVVLPAWKSTRRHLRVGPGVPPRFEPGG